MTDVVDPVDVALRTRPTQARSIATFNSILDAAARVLEIRGFGALTTNAVADEAGLTVRAIYRYFPNKHALVAELAQRMSDRWTDALVEPDGMRRAPLADRWSHYLDVFVQAVDDTPGGRAVLLAMRSDPTLARIDEAANRRYVADIAADLRAEVPALDEARATTVATVMLRSAIAVVDELFARADRAERERLLGTLDRMHVALLRDMGAAPPSGSSAP